ncbi:transcriptional regulator [Terriglobus roseus DSM 18391]|uniref:Transcriptional regulator n=1 Tax=Terriglobus roseus (strain DSM 18391 / NRRL B-41598 / KBS 63) TaxID=926566 RepID=I3ZEI6_TERRK|nr:FMN-binding negative transcriptional regulator [Terriglobus roseus]AFL87654.1 transcriptional regulator [Terriglobus roseus DSM 18391]
MYNSPHFEITSTQEMHAVVRACGLAQFITATAAGLLATPLPLFLDASEGTFGTLYGHVARANQQWKTTPEHEALAIFPTVDAYITPSWYEIKAETGKVVPTWDYETVHAYGTVEFFDDPERLLDAVTRLTDLHEDGRPEPWRVTDAPDDFIRSQLRGIVGIRMPITRLEGKRKMSQNRSEADRSGVVTGLTQSERAEDRLVAALVPLKES